MSSVSLNPAALRAASPMFCDQPTRFTGAEA